jgi:enamine deaminase RidA (YjgF/YER057c/UK114 family)
MMYRSVRDSTLIRTGRLGEEVSLGDAQEDARQTVKNALSIAKAYLGSLDRVTRCVKLSGYVAAAPDFIEQPKVLNAASELLLTIFGNRGRHARPLSGYLFPSMHHWK